MRLVDEDGDYVELDGPRSELIEAYEEKIRELTARISDLESDVEYYKYEAARSW